MSDSDLERAFDKGYRKYLKDHYYLFKVPDIPFSKKNKQPVDRILVSKDKNIAIEIKYTSTDRMELRRLKEHQIEDLKEFKYKSGAAFILFSLNSFEKVFLTEIDDYLRFKTDLGQKSFTQDHLDLMNYQEIKVEKLRKYHRLDLKLLIPNQMVISSYL
jgi:penicillin-binding protein-related factor A (putative recombinase)